MLSLDCHTSERFRAIKLGLIHHFLRLKMPVPSQEYDSCCPFLWYVLSFVFAIWLGTFRFEFSSEFSIFVTLLFMKLNQFLEDLRCISPYVLYIDQWVDVNMICIVSISSIYIYCHLKQLGNSCLYICVEFNLSPIKIYSIFLLCCESIHLLY